MCSQSQDLNVAQHQRDQIELLESTLRDLCIKANLNKDLAKRLLNAYNPATDAVANETSHIDVNGLANTVVNIAMQVQMLCSQAAVPPIAVTTSPSVYAASTIAATAKSDVSATAPTVAHVTLKQLQAEVTKTEQVACAWRQQTVSANAAVLLGEKLCTQLQNPDKAEQQRTKTERLRIALNTATFQSETAAYLASAARALYNLASTVRTIAGVMTDNPIPDAVVATTVVPTSEYLRKPVSIGQLRSNRLKTNAHLKKLCCQAVHTQSLLEKIASSPKTQNNEREMIAARNLCTNMFSVMDQAKY